MGPDIRRPVKSNYWERDSDQNCSEEKNIDISRYKGESERAEKGRT